MTNVNRIGRDISINPITTSRAVDKKAVEDTFKVKLQDIEQEHIKLKLETIYKDIEEKTNKLQDSLFIEDLISYKHLVKEFLNVAVKNSHVFYKENSIDRQGRHRVYSIVKKVDYELDSLTEYFLDIEENRLKILKTINDISGLLMDIIA